MKTIKGDLIKLAQAGEFDVIVHGCNCFHTMGAGIAKQIRLAFPHAYDIDRETNYGDPDKLGRISSTFRKDGLVIVNAYTQFAPGKEVSKDLYANIENCFRLIKNLYYGQKIGVPWIGAGIAGGDWNKIYEIISRVMIDQDITAVEYQGMKQMEFIW